jgi:hypothetical protein
MRGAPETNSTTRQTINPHLTLITYGQIRPGDRIVNGYLNPTRDDAHLLARPVREIVRTYRNTGFDDHCVSARHRFTCYDHVVIVWRDTNGSLFGDRADETVCVAPAA